ncbi:interleukin-12 receptor subunit beta-2 [Heteronotia binoei]|uniref:interleukin-12 receptor subunit beta-2 n=1 Tax=Heteronotia binoei TaxID=13085 RepID=UPI00292E010B|nr:interleukin-12 receptor subunit beta-2 [Heteronotia binoei]
MFFSWNAFLTIWLLSWTGIGVNFGSVEDCDEGSMNASSTDVSRGSNVTLSCLINRNKLGHVWDTYEIAIFQNGSKVNRSYGCSVNAHVLMHTFGKQTFECKSAGRVSRLLICGIYINVGIPPDQPKNVSCIQYGKNGTMTCTWKEGRYTYFNTLYELQLINGTTNNTPFLRKHSISGSVDLVVKLGFESTYTAVVIASNKLGNAASLPFQFTLSDIVKPHSPLDISVEFDGLDGTNSTLFWQDQQDTQLFRIRFRLVNSNSWIMLENITARSYDLHDLKPDTEYEFQVSCKFFLDKGLWSDWSKPLQTEAVRLSTGIGNAVVSSLGVAGGGPGTEGESHGWTGSSKVSGADGGPASQALGCTMSNFGMEFCNPDAAAMIGLDGGACCTAALELVPLGPFDIWYFKKDISSQMENITLFWKNMNPSETRGKSHPCRVTFRALNQKPHQVTEAHCATKSVFSQVMPISDYKITVYYYNSRGISPPIYITTDLEISDLLSPSNLTAASMGNGSIFLAWTAPPVPSSFINGYVVEWAEPHQAWETHSNWLKIPVTSYTIITEPLKPYVCYHIHVFALYGNRAGKAICTTGDASSKVPLIGPHINTTVRNGSIFVFWTEIPEELQVGCIVSYKIYMQQKSPNVDAEVYDIPKAAPQPFSIKNVQAGVAYILWMTASTKAGEGPKGNESFAFTNEPSWAPVVVLCIIGLFIMACCAMYARLQGFSLFSGWYNKAVPDPANSSWAKKFTSVENELSSHSSLFLNNPDNLEEPETLQIEEVLIKRQSHGFEDVLFSEIIEKIESHTWPTESDTLDQHQLLFLYKKVSPEEPNQDQVFSDYLVNPLEDTTVDYLPSTILPTITNTAEDDSEAEFDSFNIFSRTFLSQTFSLCGKLTLDAIKVDCNSFTD